MGAGVHGIEGYELDDELRAQMVAQRPFLVPTLLETIAPVTASPRGAAKSAKWHAMAHDSIAASVAAGVRVAAGNQGRPHRQQSRRFRPPRVSDEPRKVVQ